MTMTDRAQFLRDGFLVVRDAIPSPELKSLRTSYETLLDRQRDVWRQERSPGDPPGGLWDTAAQPRLRGCENFVDSETADAVELWLSEPILGTARQLIDSDVGVTGMYMMCNPTYDYGPANWHRDIHPIDLGPMEQMQKALIESGPTYIQWNIPLYDDDVLWVVPGSHIRLNTEEETRSLLTDNRVPIPGGVQVALQAGDVLVYINYILHWGSSYRREPRRRTIHGGHTIYPNWIDLGFTQHLSDESRRLFEDWSARTVELKNDTERALRSVLDSDAAAYAKALKALRPSTGSATQVQLTIWLCKAAMHIHNLKRMDYDRLPDEFVTRAASPHPITLNWGPEFAERFSKLEADTLWDQFGFVEDRLLAADGEDFAPGYQSRAIPYYLESLPNEFSMDDFVSSWAEAT